MNVLKHSITFIHLHTMKMSDSVRRLGVAAAVACGSVVSALAEETGGSTSTSLAADVIDDAQSSLEGILTSAGGAVSSIIVAGLAIWGAIAIVGVLKRAFSAGKGR